eukprot:493195-Amorphochlora_amoeboformis.AAC.1
MDPEGGKGSKKTLEGEGKAPEGGEKEEKKPSMDEAIKSRIQEGKKGSFCARCRKDIFLDIFYSALLGFSIPLPSLPRLPCPICIFSLFFLFSVHSSALSTDVSLTVSSAYLLQCSSGMRRDGIYYFVDPEL